MVPYGHSYPYCEYISTAHGVRLANKQWCSFVPTPLSMSIFFYGPVAIHWQGQQCHSPFAPLLPHTTLGHQTGILVMWSWSAVVQRTGQGYCAYSDSDLSWTDLLGVDTGAWRTWHWQNTESLQACGWQLPTRHSTCKAFVPGGWSAISGKTISLQLRTYQSVDF